MESGHLDQRIDELEELISSAFSPLPGRRIHHRYSILGQMVYDWRPAWEKAREIQEWFKSGVRYPTASQRDNAWTRFNNIRNELSRRSNADREAVFSVSQSWRDEIIGELHSARYVYVPILDEINPTTADNMKVLGQGLRDARTALHENRHQMLKEHKDECYALAEEIKQSHDRFWECYHSEREARKQSHLQSMRGSLHRTDANIDKNTEKRRRAVDALQHAEDNIEKLQGMLEVARSDDYRGRVETWLFEAIEKRNSIRESVHRIDEWIAQDRERRNELAAKIAARE
jgi:hypothetical protein